MNFIYSSTTKKAKNVVINFNFDNLKLINISQQYVTRISTLCESKREEKMFQIFLSCPTQLV